MAPLPMGTSLKIISNMPQNGVIFSDGIEDDRLDFNSGAIATIGAADRVLARLFQDDARCRVLHSTSLSASPDYVSCDNGRIIGCWLELICGSGAEAGHLMRRGRRFEKLQSCSQLLKPLDNCPG